MSQLIILIVKFALALKQTTIDQSNFLSLSFWSTVHQLLGRPESHPHQDDDAF